VLLTMAVANNYAARMRRKRKHWVHPLIAEQVSTYGNLITCDSTCSCHFLHQCQSKYYVTTLLSTVHYILCNLLHCVNYI
jgi:hypothetical protein